MSLQGSQIPEPLPWEENREPGFSQPTLALQQILALGLLNYTKSLILFVPQHDKQALGAPTQQLGGKQTDCFLRLTVSPRSHTVSKRLDSSSHSG